MDSADKNFERQPHSALFAHLLTRVLQCMSDWRLGRPRLDLDKPEEPEDTDAWHCQATADLCNPSGSKMRKVRSNPPLAPGPFGWCEC